MTTDEMAVVGWLTLSILWSAGMFVWGAKAVLRRQAMVLAPKPVTKKCRGRKNRKVFMGHVDVPDEGQQQNRRLG